MAATTTESKHASAKYGQLIMYSTVVGKTSDGTSLMGVSTGGYNVIGGFIGAATDPTGIVYRFPINNPKNKVLLVGIWDGLASTTCYSAIALRRSNDNAGNKLPASVGLSIGTSTVGTGWQLIKCTDFPVATSTENQTYVLALRDTKKYAFVSATSGISYDKYQQYIEVRAGYSTCSTASFLALATNYSSNEENSVHLAMFEVP